jgi:pyruvate/2-oxoglutarate dehydrogenase complex dihydrolipoamide dehydrogenase (E3) component
MNVDAIVVGSGQAGVPLAVRLAQAGKQVILVERGEIGGTCVNTGCTPTKTMLASARAAHVARTAGRLGVHAREVTVDFPAIVARKDAIVRRWREGPARRIDGAGVKLIAGHARLAGPHEIEVNGERHQAPLIVLDVGARPAVPAIPGLEATPYLHNRTVMELPALPEHLIVLGGGYIGCEFGQMFRRFGARVTIIHRHAHLIDAEDPETSTSLEEVFAGEGIELQLDASVASVGRNGDGVVVRLRDGRELAGSHLLLAVGRRPNTDDLGCERAGVTLDPRGHVVVDDGYLTSAPGIYAVGDVTGPPQFTHTAWDDHRILFDRLMRGATRGRRDRLVPFSVFTDPQVARVGLTEREARAQGLACEVATMPFGQIARAIEVDETAGTMKVLIDPRSERILGCTLVGSEAGELIHIFAALMQARASVRALVDLEAVHPTFAEGVQSLVMKLPRFKLS